MEVMRKDGSDGEEEGNVLTPEEHCAVHTNQPAPALALFADHSHPP